MKTAHDWTDKELEKMEKHLTAIYEEAQSGIREKWDAYMERAEKRIEKYEKALETAKESGDSDKIKKAKEELKKRKENITIRNEYYKDMVDETTTRLANTNEIALSYLNGEMPRIYREVYNIPESDEAKIDIKLSIRSEQTVARMIKDGDIQLPNKKLDIPKDKRWNTKQLNSQVLQGILQGEDMSKISKRILPVVNNDKDAAIRNARTMVTGAENRGKQDRFKSLEDKGAIVTKIWMATPDGRTRDSHIDIDGDEVEIGENFSNGLEYPGDPGGDPAEVYNCRCTMHTHIKGFRKANGEVVYVDESLRDTDTLHERQIEKEQERRERAKILKSENSNGKETITEKLLKSYDSHIENNNLSSLKSKDLPELFIKQNQSDLSKISDEVRKDIESTISRLSEEYDTSLLKVITMEEKETVGNTVFATTRHNYGNDTSAIFINPIKCKNEKILYDRINELEKSGYCVNVERMKEYIPTHEFAHSLITMQEPLVNSKNFVNADYKKYKDVRKEIEGVYGDYISKLGKLETSAKKHEMEFILGVSEESGKTAKKEYEEIRQIKLSKYSMTNSDEFMAEAFTHYKLSNEKNEYSQKVGKIIDKYFKKG